MKILATLSTRLIGLAKLHLVLLVAVVSSPYRPTVWAGGESFYLGRDYSADGAISPP